VYRVLCPKQTTDSARRARILQAYRERASLRGVERIFKTDRHSILKWIEARVAQLPNEVLPKKRGDILEVDEVWSFVYQRDNQTWLWTALCRRTRQIVGFAIGDRSEVTCRRLWASIPAAYRRCRTYSDFWHAYQAVLPVRTHRAVGKETGQTAHQERWYNTLRQWVGRFTRKTLSFSKTDKSHELVTRWFILESKAGSFPAACGVRMDSRLRSLA
jgi:insertion element IS1 protein InsB